MTKPKPKSKSKPKSKPKSKAKAKALLDSLRKPTSIRLTLEQMALKLARQQTRLEKNKKDLKFLEEHLARRAEKLKSQLDELHSNCRNLVIHELFVRGVYHAFRRFEESKNEDKNAVFNNEVASHKESFNIRMKAFCNNGNLPLKTFTFTEGSQQ